MSGSQDFEFAIGPEAVASVNQILAGAPLKLTFVFPRRLVHQEGDVAWVNATGELRIEPRNDPPFTEPYRMTVIMVRRDGEWRWHTMAGCVPKATPHTATAS
jgi:ketosteroid isomerase-like protein